MLYNKLFSGVSFMKIEETKFVLKDGTEVFIKSATAKDAGILKSLREATALETHFMAREAEDGQMSEEKIFAGLEAIEKSERDFMVNAYLNGEIIGDLGVVCMRDLLKMRHRAYLGMSIRQKYTGQGLGTFMIELAVKQAKKNGFEQLELGVFSDNAKARHLYEKAGFKEYGMTPRAFKLKDGTYCDEIIMVNML